MNQQLCLFGVLKNFSVGDEVFYVSLDVIEKAIITAIGKYINWTTKSGEEWYCVANAANEYLFYSRDDANNEVMKYKKQFKGSK